MTIHIEGTNQEIFDRVCAHLARQGVRAITNGRCEYRTASGLRCAIGGLLPDDGDYAPFEGTSIEGLIADDLISTEANVSLLEDLQDAHDYSWNAPELRDKLYEIAGAWELDAGAADQIRTWSS